MEAHAIPEVDFVPGSLVVGDLHLDVGGEHAPPRFLAWLDQLRDVPRLVVLGDLFDAWIGPAHLGLGGAQETVRAFAALVARGTEVDVLWGNRDFLLDRGFEEASGVRVRRSGLIGRTEGGRVLMIHGDELCTRDRAYQRLRRVIRSGPVRFLIRHLPRPIALRAAARLRRASTQAVARKPSEDKAMQVEAVERQLESRGCGVLVCGHAHEFRDEPVGGGGRWMVVDDWGRGRDQVRVLPGGELVGEASGAAEP